MEILGIVIGGYGIKRVIAYIKARKFVAGRH